MFFYNLFHLIILFFKALLVVLSELERVLSMSCIKNTRLNTNHNCFSGCSKESIITNLKVYKQLVNRNLRTIKRKLCYMFLKYLDILVMRKMKTILNYILSSLLYKYFFPPLSKFLCLTLIRYLYGRACKVPMFRNIQDHID